MGPICAYYKFATLFRNAASLWQQCGSATFFTSGYKQCRTYFILGYHILPQVPHGLRSLSPASLVGVKSTQMAHCMMQWGMVCTKTSHLYSLHVPLSPSISVFSKQVEIIFKRCDIIECLGCGNQSLWELSCDDVMIIENGAFWLVGIKCNFFNKVELYFNRQQ